MPSAKIEKKRESFGGKSDFELKLQKMIKTIHGRDGFPIKRIPKDISTAILSIPRSMFL